MSRCYTVGGRAYTLEYIGGGLYRLCDAAGTVRARVTCRRLHTDHRTGQRTEQWRIKDGAVLGASAQEAVNRWVALQEASAA